VIELSNVLSGELISEETGDEEGLLSVSVDQLDDARPQTLPIRGASGRKVDRQPIVLSADVSHEIDDLEGVAGGNTNQEVDPGLGQSLQHFMGWVPPVEHEDIALLEMREHVQHVLPLAGPEGVDAEIHRDLGTDVEQSAHERLRTMGSFGDAEDVAKIGMSLKIDFAPVDGKDPTAMPASVFIEVFP